MPTLLVTGAAGFIGSHTVLELLNAGYEVIAVDNFVNAVEDPATKLPIALQRVQGITGKKVTFYRASMTDEAGLRSICEKHKIDCTIHFAALKAVGESVAMPLDYYANNVGGTVNLLKVLRDFGYKNVMFSSSATVYGTPQFLPLSEEHPTGLGVTNPYGKSKFMCEMVMQDLYQSDQSWNILLLRYFNPVGAHSSGMIGEDPAGVPANLMPFVSQVAVGKRPHVNVFGKDYDTPDGTGVRDYLHVVDCALGHLATLRHMEKQSVGIEVLNLGTGRGYSVLEMIEAMKKATGKDIPYKIEARRAGDIASCYCDTTKAKRVLGWEAGKDIDDMCKDLWNWQTKNPNGFRGTD